MRLLARRVHKRVGVYPRIADEPLVVPGGLYIITEFQLPPGCRIRAWLSNRKDARLPSTVGGTLRTHRFTVQNTAKMERWAVGRDRED
jgi:hypothetical protein